MNVNVFLDAASSRSRTRDTRKAAARTSTHFRSIGTSDHYSEFTAAPNTYAPALPGLEFTRSQLGVDGNNWKVKSEIRTMPPFIMRPMAGPLNQKDTEGGLRKRLCTFYLLSIFCLCPQLHKGDPTPTIKSIVFNGQTNVLIPFPLTRLFLPESSGNRTEKTETMNRIENGQAILWSRGNMQSIEHDDLDYSDRHSIGLWPCTVHWAVGAGGARPRKWWLCTNQRAFQPLQKKAPCKTELQEPSNLRWQRLKWAIKCP